MTIETALDKISDILFDIACVEGYEWEKIEKEIIPILISLKEEQT